MSETSKQWVQGCAIGCGAVVLFSIFLLVGFTFSMRSTFNTAHKDRQVLDEQFGSAEDFTPAIDGSVADDRVVAFLMVREAMAEINSRLATVDREMGDFEEMAEDEDPPLRVALPAVARLTKSMIGLPKVFGEIEQTRNRALVEADMGLGEYTYIFVMAYHDELVGPATGVHLFGGSPVNERIRDELRSMIRRQLEAASAIAGDGDEWTAVLTSELVALDADESRIPWADGRPASIVESFKPRRDRLDATYSAASAELELLNSTVNNGGLQITMD